MGLKTPAEKAAFIRDLTQSVTETILAQCDNMPEEWDGHELRQLLADKFDEQVSQFMDASRKRVFRRQALALNIL